MKSRLFGAVAAVGIFTSAAAMATDPFTLNLSLGTGQSATAGFTKIEDFINVFDDAGLRSVNAAYTNTSIATGTVSIRGLAATVSYQTTGTTLTFKVPSIGVNETFKGATRDASQQLFEDFLEKNGSDILTKMLSQLAATSTVDPVAGNPKSLMSNMVASSFDPKSTIGEDSKTTPPSGEVSNKIALNPAVGNYSAGDFDQTTVSLPLGYTFYFENPEQQIIVDLPLDYVDTNGAETYGASLGLAYRFPVMEDWALTPGARIGATGSIDLGSAASIYSFTLKSEYDIYYDDYKITFGNMGGYYQTIPIDAGDFTIDYDLTNMVVKNGVNVEGSLDFTMFGKPTSWQASVANTQFFGDELAIDNYFDVAVSFGTRSLLGESSFNNLRVGVTGTFGDDYSGFMGNLGYKF